MAYVAWGNSCRGFGSPGCGLFVCNQEISIVSHNFMKKKILYVFLGALLFIVIIAATDDTVDNTTTQSSITEVTESEETVEEKQARWNRGEFTEEEIKELEAEEVREDAVIEQFDEQIEAGVAPEDVDLEEVWGE